MAGVLPTYVRLLPTKSTLLGCSCRPIEPHDVQKRNEKTKRARIRIGLGAANAGVKPPCGGAADMCKRSAKHMADATTRGRLERIVRWRWMPMRTQPRCTCRKTKREGPDAHPRTFSRTLRNDSISSGHADRYQSPFLKTANVTPAMCERARRTWPKNQRADNLTEEQCQPKPGNEICEQHNCRELFCRLTPELSRPVAGWRTCASVA